MVPSAPILKIGANRCVKDLSGGARGATSGKRVGDGAGSQGAAGAADKMGEARGEPPWRRAQLRG